jgi:hypothetical protein
MNRKEVALEVLTDLVGRRWGVRRWGYGGRARRRYAG